MIYDYLIYYYNNFATVQDECSFVSLRDVERALVLFIYFLEVFTDVFNVRFRSSVVLKGYA